MAERPVVDVVAAALMRPDGAYLLAQRPEGKVYAGYWEFPGGKVEPGESPFQAIRREIREELGVEVITAHPWLLRRHDYEHARVRLRFFRVVEWHGTPVGLDGQRFAFQIPGQETVGPMLPANGPVLRAMALPEIYAITHLESADAADAFLARLDAALARGVRLVQIRERVLEGPARLAFARAVTRRCHQVGARVLVNGDAELAGACGADGVHLRSDQLRAATMRPPLEWVGASTHDAAELQKAAALGCDFAVLGPVKPTPSHPGAPALGWPAWRALAAQAECPVFALGGMGFDDLEAARESGAHGIAMLRGAWT